MATAQQHAAPGDIEASTVWEPCLNKCYSVAIATLALRVTGVSALGRATACILSLTVQSSLSSCGGTTFLTNTVCDLDGVLVQVFVEHASAAL